MNLTDNQKRILEKTINESLRQPNFELYLSGRQIQNFKSILLRLSNEKLILSKEETLCLANLFSERITKIGHKYPSTLLSWTNIPLDIQELMEEKDEYLEILSKVNQEYIENAFHYNLKFRSKNIIETLDKLRKCDVILLSRNPEPYKIGFVFQQREALLFPLEAQIDLTVVSFSHYDKTIRAMFSESISRKEAYEILLKCKKTNYPKDSIDFLLEILK
ncbi:MAG: hypothetical protein EHM93_17155 [Bacteroidales bacterium]|nr:MAG: hypothetical protein EHM93_17155 [Bacteroidales bacterium]